MLKPGDKMPDLVARDQDEKEVKLRDFKGSKLVIFFYPQDDTPTCIKEACNLRDNYGLLTKNGFKLLGVSVDDAKSHRKFIKKYRLPFPLLTDTEHRLVDAFGVWGEKTNFGRTYMGTHRATFVINAKGILEQVIFPVVSGSHAAQILESNKI